MAIVVQSSGNYGLRVFDESAPTDYLVNQPRSKTWFDEEALDAGFVKFIGGTSTYEDNISTYRKWDSDFKGFPLAANGVLNGDDSNTPFTEATFRTWCENNLAGFNDGGATSLTTLPIERTAVSKTTASKSVAVTDTTIARTITIATADIQGVMTKQFLFVKDESGGALVNNITIDCEGGESIDGVLSVPINGNYGYVEFYSDGTNVFTK